MLSKTGIPVLLTLTATILLAAVVQIQAVPSTPAASYATISVAAAEAGEPVEEKNEEAESPDINEEEETESESSGTAAAERNTSQEKKSTPSSGGERKVTYTSHTVQSGETLWNISQQRGIPMPELLQANSMTEHTPIYPGMKLTVPVHHVPVKEPAKPGHGELLDWWTEAQYVWPVGTEARIVDYYTGQSFRARRLTGAFHADVEPVTAADTEAMKRIWGGSWSWKTRPILVEIDGRVLAASSNGMPHNIQSIYNNNFNGHFCIHFLNSTRHKDNLMQTDHQRNVRIAAGKS